MSNSLVFEATKDGHIKVERVFADVVIDRFIVYSKESAVKFGKDRPWVHDALNILHQPSANVETVVPPMPVQEFSISERLERVQKQCDEALALTEHFAHLVESKQL